MSEFRATLSVLDRLSNWDTKWGRTRTGSVDDIKDSIRRHLDWLLNTRQPRRTELGAFPGLRGTVLDYGLPDVAIFGLDDSGAQDEFARSIQNAIRAFEPRLTGVSVIPVVEGGSLTFRVRAHLRVEAARERVVFRAILEPSSGRLATGELRSDA